ncbi:unnamed protein product [Malus baccata var. baccata]
MLKNMGEVFCGLRHSKGVVVGGTNLHGSVSCDTLRFDFCYGISFSLWVTLAVLDSLRIHLLFGSYMAVTPVVASESLAAVDCSSLMKIRLSLNYFDEENKLKQFALLKFI